MDGLTGDKNHKSSSLLSPCKRLSNSTIQLSLLLTILYLYCLSTTHHLQTHTHTIKTSTSTHHHPPSRHANIPPLVTTEPPPQSPHPKKQWPHQSQPPSPQTPHPKKHSPPTTTSTTPWNQSTHTPGNAPALCSLLFLPVTHSPPPPSSYITAHNDIVSTPHPSIHPSIHPSK